MVGLSDISVIIKETFHYVESQRNILSEEHFSLKSICDPPRENRKKGDDTGTVF